MKCVSEFACAACPCEPACAAFQLKFLAFAASLLLAACTGAPATIARGAPCDLPGVVTVANGMPYECGRTADGGTAWMMAGPDIPVGKAARNGECATDGALALAPDGSLLRCTWNNSDLMIPHGPELTDAQ